MRTGDKGIFPLAHVVDVEYNDFDPTGFKMNKLSVLGPEISSHLVFQLFLFLTNVLHWYKQELRKKRRDTFLITSEVFNAHKRVWKL